MEDGTSEELTDEEIMDTIEDLEDGKATGPDGISNKMKKSPKIYIENDEECI